MVNWRLVMITFNQMLDDMEPMSVAVVPTTVSYNSARTLVSRANQKRTGEYRVLKSKVDGVVRVVRLV